MLDRALGPGARTPWSTGSCAAILQPFFHVYFRLSRIGREHIPASGPVIIAQPPPVPGPVRRRDDGPQADLLPVEARGFRPPAVAWLLNSPGRLPDRPRPGDRAARDARRQGILERGDIVLIFPEGTRTPPRPLRRPRRGVALALETGAPVIPVAVIGTEAVRRGGDPPASRAHARRARPSASRRVEHPQSPRLAAAVTERIWPCVELQWEWLGGTAAHSAAPR